MTGSTVPATGDVTCSKLVQADRRLPLAYGRFYFSRRRGTGTMAIRPINAASRRECADCAVLVEQRAHPIQKRQQNFLGALPADHFAGNDRNVRTDS